MEIPLQKFPWLSYFHLLESHENVKSFKVHISLEKGKCTPLPLFCLFSVTWTRRIGLKLKD